ncbi:unnamed protein product [Trichobilharzia regenti]|nr:unnamed protein product [Trichobilharzia regenti]
MGRRRPATNCRQHFTPDKKQNELFEKYYKNQGVVPDDEWENFVDYLKRDLPITFRVTGFRSQNKELLRLIKQKYRKDISEMQQYMCDENGNTNGTFDPLPWYPNEMAWQLSASNISRQEAVSMLPPLLLDVRSHHTVLDLCAAPVKRLQSPCVVITQQDATCFPRLYLTQSSDEKGNQQELHQLLFDRVLADVPCSGDGTLRKNPDLWLRWSPNLGIGEHPLQCRILKRGLELLRDPVDGSTDFPRLVYSTCSFNPVENEAVVAKILHACQGSVRLVEPDLLRCKLSHSSENNSPVVGKFIARPGLTNWRVMDKKGVWFTSYDEVPTGQQNHIRPSLFPPANVADLHLEYCRRVLPHDQNTGGFFIAVLEKVTPLPWMNTLKREFPVNNSKTDLLDDPSEQKNNDSGNGKFTVLYFKAILLFIIYVIFS